MASEAIKVEGLKELQVALKQVDRDAPKAMGVELAKISSLVRDKAAAKVPRRSGDAAASIKVRKKQRGAVLAIGGSKAPYMPWLNFGGRVGRAGAVFRPIKKPDYFIYRTLSEEKNVVDRMLNEALERLGRKAGFEVER